MPPTEKDPKNHEKRISALEEAMHRHFEESGEIRADLAWLKKAMFMCGGAAMASTGSLIVGIVLAILSMLHK